MTRAAFLAGLLMAASLYITVAPLDSSAELGCGNDSECGMLDDDEALCDSDEDCMRFCPPPADDPDCDGGPQS